MKRKLSAVERRKLRVRKRLRAKSNVERPRLSVFRSSKHIYAQIIDDLNRRTLVSASSMEKDCKTSKGSALEVAEVIGKLLADRAKKVGVAEVVFDRGSYLYHGRVKMLAEAARGAGLKF